jgi:L-alanine-DL-glutamate epimerase-like enolase superfamily enzyme
MDANATSLSFCVEHYPLARAFVISRGAKTQADVIHVTLNRNGFSGHGECVPYARYGESIETVSAALEALRPQIEAGLDRHDLQTLMPAGAARNALDCALWDLECKSRALRCWTLAGVPAPVPLNTAYTLSVDTPHAMFNAARAAQQRPLLKIKLSGKGDQERLRAVRAGAPDSTLIVDANEAWSEDELDDLLALCAALGVRLVEQPLPAGRDHKLSTCSHAVPICADESLHTADDLAHIKSLYDVINIKLDKTGGLTQALVLAEQARAMNLGLFIGCMVGTSLSMAPALLLTAHALFVDLDGPLLLAHDRANGLRYEGSQIMPPSAALWG